MGVLSAVVVLAGCLVVSLPFVLVYALVTDARRLRALGAADHRGERDRTALREAALQAFHERQQREPSANAG